MKFYLQGFVAEDFVLVLKFVIVGRNLASDFSNSSLKISSRGFNFFLKWIYLTKIISFGFS